MAQLLFLLEFLCVLLLITQVLFPLIFTSLPYWWAFKKSFWEKKSTTQILDLEDFSQKVNEKREEKIKYEQGAQRLKEEVDEKVKEALKIKKESDNLG